MKLLAALLAAPLLLLAAEAAAQSPYRDTVTPAELARLRGGSAAPLPTIRLWDEVGARNPARPVLPGAVSHNGGTITVRIGR
jgi:hypothetical protein